MSGASAQDSPPITLMLERCEEITPQSLLPLLKLELGTSVALSDHMPDRSTHVVVLISCQPDQFTVTVEGPSHPKLVRQFDRSSSTSSSQHARLVALATSESLQDWPLTPMPSAQTSLVQNAEPIPKEELRAPPLEEPQHWLFELSTVYSTRNLTGVGVGPLLRFGYGLTPNQGVALESSFLFPAKVQTTQMTIASSMQAIMLGYWYQWDWTQVTLQVRAGWRAERFSFEPTGVRSRLLSLRDVEYHVQGVATGFGLHWKLGRHWRVVFGGQVGSMLDAVQVVASDTLRLGGDQEWGQVEVGVGLRW